ncbi:MAG TPA: cytochrome c family protein, partial [Burkholderiaceae bacterium]|nr:cytochrome c family protein [Burkholderiaceae bacterium]
ARAADGPRVTAYEPMLLQGSETKADAGQDEGARVTILKHRKFVADDGVLEKMADRSQPAGASYVGSDKCAGCHLADFTAWKASKHADAWQVLEKAEMDRAWPVTRYPDCVSCHVVGYRKPGGFVSAKETPLLVNVGCERCHGPGSAHVDSGGATRLGKVAGDLPKSTLCTQCHDFEQTPKFDYTSFWAIIQHGAKATPPKKPLKLGGR